MAPAYKLTYFNFTGLAEPIRYLFAYGNIEYEDVRIDFAKWPEFKKDMPFGQMPVLEHNGKTVGQSLAICRYVAKQVKLTGKNDWEDLEIDSMVDTINDLRVKIAQYRFEQNETVKESIKEKLFDETIPYYLERLDAAAKKNNGYLTLGRLTWADIYFAGLIETLDFVLSTVLITNHKNLVALKNNIENIPSIKVWISKRPPIPQS